MARVTKKQIGAMLTWDRHVEPQFLKGTGRLVDGPVGSSVLIQHVAEGAIPRGMTSGVHRVASQMEKYAQANRTWTDRTGDARASLAGDVVINEPSFAAVIRGGGGLDYFIHLMNMKGGRYDIISATQQAFASRVVGVLVREINLELRGKGSQFRHAKTGRFV